MYIYNIYIYIFNAKHESMKNYKYFFYQYSTRSFMSLLDNHQLKVVTKVQITI